MLERLRDQGESDTELNGRGVQRDNAYAAALRATAPLAPITAVLSTVLVYVAFGEFFENYQDFGGSTILAGSSAIGIGVISAMATWLVVALFYCPRTAASRASLRNYNLLRERLARLKNQIKHARPLNSGPREYPENGIDGTIRNRVLEQALNECEEIEKGLEGRGVSWVTGMGYIELWHRVHRAEEGLVKVEPCTEVIAGAVRDESRLIDANMKNRDLLLRRLRCAVAMLDDSETGKDLNYLAEPAECSLPREKRATPENRAKATTILSEVRYEINYFRDNVWEGIVHARNRLADASVLLGCAAYVLLILAILAGASHDTILWVAAYFLVGAIAGLFARAQAEWTTDTAVDDFGLSSARLVHIPWLSGLAAVGGVLVTALVDSKFMGNAAGGSTLVEIFDDDTLAFLVVAAIFGLTPDLIIRRLTQQADKYKEDLQSTQTSQSTETNRSNKAS